MVTASLISNFILLLFLLVPGYVALRGYLDSSVQLDTLSRIDKLFTTVLAGTLLLALVLIARRVGVIDHIYLTICSNGWNSICTYSPTLFDTDSLVKTDSISDYPALSLLAVVFIQSTAGYVGGYFAGTAIRIRSNTPQSSEKDLQQPWETAIRQSEPYDRLKIVTTNDTVVKGKLYRIGSPSEDRDILLFGATRIKENEENEPLGMSYHSFQDISQVQFPNLEPESPSPEDNYILRAWIGIKHPYKIWRSLKHNRDRVQQTPRDYLTHGQRRYADLREFFQKEVVCFFSNVAREYKIGYYKAEYSDEVFQRAQLNSLLLSNWKDHHDEEENESN